MNRILLASASIVALAGAAAAQDDEPLGIIFGGDASLGFQDSQEDDDRFRPGPGGTLIPNPGFDDETGFFYEANLSVTLRTRLDNGLVAESTFTIPVADTNLGNSEIGIDNDFVLGLGFGDGNGLFLGDVTFGAESFSFANMQSADFSEQDDEITLRGQSTFGDFTFAASGIVADRDADEPRLVSPIVTTGEGRDYLDQLSVGANGAVGRFALSFGYQEESSMLVRGDDSADTPDVDEGETVDGVYDTNNSDFNSDEQFGIAAGTTFGGFTVTAGFGQNLTVDTESYGILVAVPVGPISATAEYVIEPDADEFATATNPEPDDFSYALGAAYESDRIILTASFGEEIGEEEYDIKVGFQISEVTSVQAGYNDDDGGFAAYRQNIGQNAFFEASYAEVDDAGFGNENFVDDIREGTTFKVGLEF